MLIGNGDVRHLDPALNCSDSGDGNGMSTEVEEFTAGLLDAWPVSADLPVLRADDEPGLLAPPLGGLRRASCLFCAHTFRPGELVVVCPCRPRDPICRAAVHRDPALGLVCWESWRPGSQVNVCPVTLTRTEGS